jgi:hypothetical protein
VLDSRVKVYFGVLEITCIVSKIINLLLTFITLSISDGYIYVSVVYIYIYIYIYIYAINYVLKINNLMMLESISCRTEVSGGER